MQRFDEVEKISVGYVHGFNLFLFFTCKPGLGVKNHILKTSQKYVIFNVTFSHLFGMFGDSYLSLKHCASFATNFQPNPQKVSLPHQIFCMLFWWHILILDEKSNQNEKAESVQISGRSMCIYFYWSNVPVKHVTKISMQPLQYMYSCMNLYFREGSSGVMCLISMSSWRCLFATGLGCSLLLLWWDVHWNQLWNMWVQSYLHAATAYACFLKN